MSENKMTKEQEKKGGINIMKRFIKKHKETIITIIRLLPTIIKIIKSIVEVSIN
jgi:hypothetical protein